MILVAVALALVISLLVARRVHRRARRRSSVLDEADELRTALERLGWSVPPQTTLAELERRLGERAGPAAARYARRPRERFAMLATASRRTWTGGGYAGR